MAADNYDPVTDYIWNLQRDGRLLMRHIARRFDAALPDGVLAGMAIDGTPSDVLFVSPNLIRGSAAKLAELVSSVDILSRRAAPANVSSIRVTSAYLHIAVEVGEPPIASVYEARQVRRCMAVVQAVAFMLLFLSVGLLAHVDNGRRMLQQLSALRQQEQDLEKSLLSLPSSDSVIRPAKPARATAEKPDSPLPLSDPEDEAARLCRPLRIADPPDTSRWRQPITRQGASLCRQDDELRSRFALTYVGLADWNCMTNKIFRPWAWLTGSCGYPTGELPQEVSMNAWRSDALRVSATTAVVAGFVLPLMLGCLGASAYVMRRHDSRVSNWTLEAHDGKHAIGRLGLASLLGGLVGVVWTTDESVKVGGLTLSLAAMAFFMGYSVDAVFNVIENLITTVTAGIRGPVVPPPVIPQPSPRLLPRTAPESSSPARDTLHPKRSDPARNPNLITERMIPYNEIPKLEEHRARARDIDMIRVTALLNANVTRIIVFDTATRQPISIIRAKSPPMPPTWLPNPPAEKKIGDYLQENAGANAIDAARFGFVAQTATIDTARAALTEAKAEDLFITATGKPTEPVLGWITADLLGKGPVIPTIP